MKAMNWKKKCQVVKESEPGIGMWLQQEVGSRKIDTMRFKAARICEEMWANGVETVTKDSGKHLP
jgi:hypothetical protein